MKGFVSTIDIRPQAVGAGLPGEGGGWFGAKESQAQATTPTPDSSGRGSADPSFASAVSSLGPREVAGTPETGGHPYFGQEH